MFINKKYDIIIPHTFHAKFAGQLAALRGNDNFSLPKEVSKHDFVLGVSDHDRGYDELDTKDIVDLRDNIEEKNKARIEYIEKSIVRANSNHIANIISLTHVKTLGKDFPEYIEKINKIINTEIIVNGLHTIPFNDIQTITDLLDNISFDCSLGDERGNPRPVMSNFDKKETIDMTYSIKGNIISVTPWPFEIDKFSLVLFGYKKEGYPENVEVKSIVFEFQK